MSRNVSACRSESAFELRFHADPPSAAYTGGVSDCLFCRISLGEVPADIVYQDDATVAFRDVNPQAPVHILVIPRAHLAGFGDATDGQTETMGRLTRTVARVAAQEGIDATGYRCVVNSGVDAQQTVPHLHWHVLGGRRLGWPPG